MDPMCVFQQVDLKRIDSGDPRFRIFSYQAEQASMEINEVLGSPPPLWVQAVAHDHFILIDGFKRLAWLQAQGRQRFECLIFPENADSADLRRQRLAGKLFGPPLNLAEKAQVVAGYSDLLEPEAIYREVFPVLNLSAHKGAIEKWKRIAAHPQRSYLEALAQGILCERSALLVSTWSPTDLAATVDLFKVLRCSASIQVEILERSVDIARRDHLQVATVLRDPEIVALILRGDWNHRQKTAAVRDWLYHKRFPRLHQREAYFQEVMERAALPPSLRLQPPNYFEGRRWRLTISFTSPDQLSKDLDTALDRVRRGIVGEAMRAPAVGSGRPSQ